MSRALFDEHAELLVRLLREEEVHATGPLRPLDGETSRPRPFGELPVWIGGGSSTASIDLAARLGCPLMLPSVFAPPEAFAPLAERYREQWRACGHASPPIVGACFHAHVAPESQLARQRFEIWYGNYWEWVQQLITRYTPAAPSFPFDYDALIAGPAVVGSPEEVVDRIGRARELLDLDRMIFMFDLGGIPDSTLFPTLELFGKSVVPELRT